MSVQQLIGIVLVVVTSFSPRTHGTPIMSYKYPHLHAQPTDLNRHIYPVYSHFEGQNHDYKVVCYFGSWAVYRPGAGKFQVSSIDPFICTHLIYGFTGLGHDNRIRVLDPFNDVEDNYGKGAYFHFNQLKSINHKLKTLIAIGGWNEGSVKYSNMASDSGSRKIFIESVVEFLKKHKFDGLDLDWEYPAARGGKPQDKQNFVALLQETKAEFRKHGFLLTAAVSAGKHFMDPAYDIPQVSTHLDFINVMCYDYHGGWETFTGHNAPLYPRPDDNELNQILNVNFSVNYWISKGAPRNKLILGMGLYGRSFTLASATNTGFGAPAPQRGRAGPYTREKGSLGYNEICEAQNRESWTIVQDPFYMAPYAYKDRQWVGYDDVESIKRKVRFAKAMGLGGGMVWSIETDDFSGACHGVHYPLLRAINEEFADPRNDLPLPPTKTPSSGIEQPQSESSTTMSTTTTTRAPSTVTTPLTTTTSTPSSTTISTTSTTTGLPSSTTTSKPRTRGSSSVVRIPCTPDKFFPHPHNCSRFFSCVIDNDSFVMFEHTCPVNTVFNPKTDNCAWPMDVPDCADEYYRKYVLYIA
ncbi:chitinase-3-like protein 1 [Tachypleus tridentatus]|uniref:chitinase-3-like protein 1 n=1 Tax=Tachypleus tridentatus TaxID=6853 RepID=UPI003FD34957